MNCPKKEDGYKSSLSQFFGYCNSLSSIKNYFEVYLYDFDGKNTRNILQYLFLIANYNLYIYLTHVQVFNNVLPDCFDA